MNRASLVHLTEESSTKVGRVKGEDNCSAAASVTLTTMKDFVYVGTRQSQRRWLFSRLRMAMGLNGGVCRA